MKMYDEVTGEVYHIYAGEEILHLEDILSEEEFKQLKRDEALDGFPGGIPDWSKHYKGKKQNKIDNDNI
ncbi:MAG: hypothetical protein LUF02_05120 [Erysipelotrichaceae bacterium]|nr:hypothetical protein [Erysipelotrichaceae bacterium]